jgi:L-fuconolactonase
VIDAHVHFWDRQLSSYTWMTDEMAAIRRPFAPDHLRDDLVRHGVDRVVLVQTCPSVEETRDFLSLAGADGMVGGVVGWVDLTAVDVGSVLAELLALPEGRHLVGVRHQVHDEPDPGWLARQEVRRGLRAVEAAGLVYDLLVRPRELPAALAVARDLPGLRMVIDHLGKPPIASGELEPWSRLMAAFAPLEHVSCKLSGLVTEAHWNRWSPAELVPFVSRAWEWFGESRLLFGSDWPVCLLATASYDEVVGAYAEALGELAPSARAKVFGSNAEVLYRLPARDHAFSGGKR